MNSIPEEAAAKSDDREMLVIAAQHFLVPVITIVSFALMLVASWYLHSKGPTAERVLSSGDWMLGIVITISGFTSVSGCVYGLVGAITYLISMRFGRAFVWLLVSLPIAAFFLTPLVL